MTKQHILDTAQQFMQTSPLAKMSQQTAQLLNLTDFSFFDEPLVGFASAEDELFEKLKEPQVIGEHFYTPREWLPSAKSVVSIFLPYSKAVKTANNACAKEDISPLWMYAKVEAQPFIDALADEIVKAVEGWGYTALVPQRDSRMAMVTTTPDGKRLFTSRWSERHIAYICGMGTFGISKGLITQKGVAGRYISIVTDMPLEADARPYTDPYEYCTRCGACVVKCPGEAITLEKGKESAKCSAFLGVTKQKYAPHYGCGRCQCGVPCANGIPVKK